MPPWIRAGGFFLVLAMVAVGPVHLLPGTEAAVGRATRDLFDHLALLDVWSLEAPGWAHPAGARLFPPDLSGMVLAWPLLQVGVGRALAHNWVMVAQLWLACMGAWALGRRYGSGMVAGVAYGLSAYLVGQAFSGEAETVAAWPLPVMLLCLERGGWRGFVLAGVVGAVGAVSSWYHAVFLAVIMLAFLIGRPDGLRTRPRGIWALAAFGCLVIGPAIAYGRVLGDAREVFRGPTMAAYLEKYPRELSGMVSDPMAWIGLGSGHSPHVDLLGWAVLVLAGLGFATWTKGEPAPGPRGWWLALVLLARNIRSTFF
jgi:hypothetical protein